MYVRPSGETVQEEATAGTTASDAGSIATRPRLTFITIDSDRLSVIKAGSRVGGSSRSRKRKTCFAAAGGAASRAPQAQALGVRQHQILLRHLLPNALGPIIIAGAFIVPGAIIAEAVLSYLGIGLRPAINQDALFPVSWGTMILDGKSAIVAQPWLLIAPALAIASITLAFTFLGDGLRDALDPRDQ